MIVPRAVLVAIYVPMAGVGYYKLGHAVETNVVDSVCNGTVSFYILLDRF
jgi:hypothetical protein